MTMSETSGQLVIIGGEEDKQGECKILREFVRLAGGLNARIVIITVAAELPRKVADEYVRVFEQLGVAHVRIVDAFTREDASTSSALQAVYNATGIFFAGGNHDRIINLIKGTELDTAIHQRYSEGIVVAGTSAGAAIIPNVMILEGEAKTNPRIEIVKLGSGMDFLPGVVIDQHFAQRGRLGRLLSALVQQPAVLGFGIDENTAVVVNGDKLQVIGAGAVTVIDVAEITHSNINRILKGEDLAFFGVKLHILPHGYGFDLNSRTPITKSELTVASPVSS